MTLEFVTESEEQTEALAARLVQALRGGDLVALSGPLGAGKTCFVRGMARGLGIDPAEVSSPTFVMCQEYACHRATLVHIDAYRIASAEDLATIGWDELVSSDALILAVEWPERIAGDLPTARIDVSLTHDGASRRRITLRAGEDLEDRLADLAGSDGRATDTKCPICSKPIDETNPSAPFCSERCRMVDLGRWFGGSYRVIRPAETEELT